MYVILEHKNTGCGKCQFVLSSDVVESLLVVPLKILTNSVVYSAGYQFCHLGVLAYLCFNT